jgi:O-antigen ligase
MSGSARHEIAADLQAANATGTFAHLSLDLLATERALWSLMPALALFLGGMTLEAPLRRRMLQVVLVTVLASAGFAFYQLSLPADSPELLYTQWGRNFGGFFINPNHQGTALVFGAVISAALFAQGLRSDAQGRLAYRYWLYALVCAACVGMIPLARGTAAALLVVVGLLAVLVMIGLMPKWMSRHPLLPRLYALGMSTLAIAVLCSAMLVRHVDADRGIMAAQTARIAAKFTPFGTGMGSFVPVYLQEQELRMAQTKTINHAHDEYVQWWLEGGVPALLVVGFALGVFSWAGWRVLACTPSRRARAVAAPAWACLLVLLLHSVVDFPMRTTTLMATAGLFAGLLLGTLSETAQDMHTRRRRDVASQRA